MFDPGKRPKDEREALIFLLKRDKPAGSSRNRTTVVFDGHPPVNTIEKESAGIAVVYSRQISADEKIKKIVDSAGNPKTVVVVSDDREVRFFARSAGARDMGVEDFLSLKKKRPEKSREGDSENVELNYSQVEKINEELRKLWLERPGK
jgi:hypothetical protein